MPNGMKRTLTGVALVLICYSLLGFLILPGIAQRIANQQLAAYATVPASLQRIERTLHLANVELIEPNVEVRFAEDGTLNLSQLFEVPESEPTASEDADTFPLRMDRLQLAGGRLTFMDQRPSEPIALVYDPLDFELHNLATRSDGSADARLTASGPSGGRIDWQGDIGLQPLTSSGQLQISDLQLKDLWPYVRDAVPLTLKDGSLEFSTNYRLDLSDDLTLRLENAKAALGPLALDSPDGHKLIRMERLELSETSLDLARQQISIGKLRSRNLETWAAREADGELDWQKLFASTSDKTDADAPTTDDTAKGANAPWQVLLRDAQLRDSGSISSIASRTMKSRWSWAR